MTNLEEQVKLLVELQALDTHIFKLEDELTAIPVQIKKGEEELKDKTNGMKRLEDSAKALQLKRKDKEGELEAKEAMIKKYQTQLYQVKTNKEYTALQEEIGRVRADSSLIEEEIIKLLDDVDNENKRAAAEKELLKREEAALNDEKERLNKDAERIKSELENLKTERAALTGKVDKDILKKYERIIKSKDRLAVVPVAGESCQGCFRILPPQVINEIKMNSQLVFCENCARILYIEE